MSLKKDALKWNPALVCVKEPMGSYVVKDDRGAMVGRRSSTASLAWWHAYAAVSHSSKPDVSMRRF
jgi:hypothetical protein